jgi:hypothetical protein
MHQHFLAGRDSFGFSDHLQNAWAYKAKAGLDCFKLTFSLIICAYLNPLVIFENGDIERTDNVTGSKFSLRPHVDDRKSFSQLQKFINGYDHRAKINESDPAFTRRVISGNKLRKVSG